MTINQYQILPIEKKHLAELVLLERLCFSQHWNLKQYQEALDQDNFKALGIFQDKNLKGYISISFMLDEAEIINLAVHPECRKMGLAGSLVSAVLRTCEQEGVKKIFLEVRPSNTAALNIYRSFGFKQVARRIKYYQDNLEDALVFRLDLLPAKTSV